MSRIWEVLASRQGRLLLLIVFIVNVIVAGMFYSPDNSKPRVLY
jgi:hypothetical protein